LNKARQQYKAEYSHAKTEPSPVATPNVEVRKLAHVKTIPEITNSKPRKMGLTPDEVKRLTASMF